MHRYCYAFVVLRDARTVTFCRQATNERVISDSMYMYVCMLNDDYVACIFFVTKIVDVRWENRHATQSPHESVIRSRGSDERIVDDVGIGAIAAIVADRGVFRDQLED